MEQSSVTAVFDHPSAARDAEAALLDAGLTATEIEVVPGESEEVLRRRRLASPNEIERGSLPPDVGGAVGFTLGFLGGGFLGLLLGSGALNIMGKEPAMAIGPFWSAAVGAALLGLAGVMAGYVLNAPLPQPDPAEAMVDTPKRRTVVSVLADVGREDEIVELLQRHGPGRVQVWRRDDGSWLPATSGRRPAHG